LAKRPADETYEDWVDERIPLKRGWEKSDSTVSKPDGGAIWDRSGQIVAPLEMISLFLKIFPGFHDFQLRLRRDLKLNKDTALIAA